MRGWACRRIAPPAPCCLSAGRAGTTRGRNAARWTPVCSGSSSNPMADKPRTAPRRRRSRSAQSDAVPRPAPAPTKRRPQGLIVGVISDTHGLVRPEALAALSGSDLIVHAGDIGSSAVVEALAAIAPVTAIRGNNDRDAWARALPETTTVEVDGTWLYI